MGKAAKPAKRVGWVFIAEASSLLAATQPGGVCGCEAGDGREDLEGYVGGVHGLEAGCGQVAEFAFDVGREGGCVEGVGGCGE